MLAWTAQPAGAPMPLRRICTWLGAPVLEEWKGKSSTEQHISPRCSCARLYYKASCAALYHGCACKCSTCMIPKGGPGPSMHACHAPLLILSTADTVLLSNLQIALSIGIKGSAAQVNDMPECCFSPRQQESCWQAWSSCSLLPLHVLGQQSAGQPPRQSHSERGYQQASG